MRKENVAVKVATEAFDPAVWSIVTVLSAAVIYLACLI
jgi:hypothetical protein